jgi:PhzF family phenazine biosynthesis protein
MRLPFYQVDAFTSKVFGGNPAAVVLLPEPQRGPQQEPQSEPLPERTMQAIGAENNLSETAFVQPRQDGDAEDTFGLRWFTPTVEVEKVTCSRWISPRGRPRRPTA